MLATSNGKIARPGQAHGAVQPDEADDRPGRPCDDVVGRVMTNELTERAHSARGDLEPRILTSYVAQSSGSQCNTDVAHVEADTRRHLRFWTFAVSECPSRMFERGPITGASPQLREEERNTGGAVVEAIRRRLRASGTRAVRRCDRPRAHISIANRLLDDSVADTRGLFDQLSRSHRQACVVTRPCCVAGV